MHGHQNTVIAITVGSFSCQINTSALCSVQHDLLTAGIDQFFYILKPSKISSTTGRNVDHPIQFTNCPKILFMFFIII